MADVHRLQACRRCRHLFVAAPGQRLCPDCLSAVRRERARRNLFAGNPTWRPLVIFAAATLAAGFLAVTLRPGLTSPVVWLAAIGALVFIGRTS